MVRTVGEKRLGSAPSDRRLTDYQILFQSGVRAGVRTGGVDDRAMCLAPLCYWLLEKLDPQRVLTVGPGCELLHITMCQKAVNHVMQARCVHLAEGFSEPFLEARKAFSSLSSQLLVPDPSTELFGVKGRFELIFVFSAEPLSQAKVEDWKSALTPDGLLLVCSQGKGEMPEGEGTMVWQFGPQKLLLASPKSTDGQISTLEQLRDALSLDHSSLSNALAASMVDLALREKNANRDHYETRVAALEKEHALELISMMHKLAQIEEENIDLRQKLKSKMIQLEGQIGTQIGAQIGEAPSQKTDTGEA